MASKPRKGRNNKREAKQELNDPFTQLESEENVQKYKTAGSIATKVLDELVKMCKPGQIVHHLCALGDKRILDEVSKMGKGWNGGIAFPTSASINSVAGCYSPHHTDQTRINNGDLVKLELGVHVDGFPALVAYPVIVKEGDCEISEGVSNVVKASSKASREILKVMKPGKTNYDIVEILNGYANKFNCNLPYVTEDCFAPGVMSFQMSRYVIDGYNDDDDEFVHHFILNREHEDYDFGMVNMELEEDEVYSIDVVYSTGSGRLRRAELEPMIYKRTPDIRKNLKLQASRNTLNSFRGRFPTNIRDNVNPRFKMGLKECLGTKVITNYPVLEDPGQYISRVKFTVIVRDEPILITGRSTDEQLQKLK